MRKFLKMLLLLFVIKTSIAQTSCYTDSLVLLDLYNATAGEQWFNNKNWLSEKPIDQWYGIVTDTSGRVVKIDLRDNNLTGELPESIMTLDSLQHPLFEENILQGYIPPFHTHMNVSNFYGKRANEFEAIKLFAENKYSLTDILQNEEIVNILFNSESSLIYTGLWNQKQIGQDIFIRGEKDKDYTIDLSEYKSDTSVYYTWFADFLTENCDTTNEPVFELQAFSPEKYQTTIFCNENKTVGGKTCRRKIANIYFSFTDNIAPGITATPQNQNIYHGNKFSTIHFSYSDDFSNPDSLQCKFTYLPQTLDCFFSDKKQPQYAASLYWFRPVDVVDKDYFYSWQLQSALVYPKNENWIGTDSIQMECTDREGISSDKTVYFTIENFIPSVPAPKIKKMHFANDGSFAYATWSAPDSLTGFIAKCSHIKLKDSDCNDTIIEIVIDSLFLSAGSDSVYFNTGLSQESLANTNIKIEIIGIYNELRSNPQSQKYSFFNNLVSITDITAHYIKRTSYDIDLLLKWNSENSKCNEEYYVMMSENGSEYIRRQFINYQNILKDSCYIYNCLKPSSQYSFYITNNIRNNNNTTSYYSDTVRITTPNETPFIVADSLVYNIQYFKSFLKKNLVDDDYTSQLIWTFSNSSIIDIKETDDSIYFKLRDTSTIVQSDTIYFNAADELGKTVDTAIVFHILQYNSPVSLQQNYPPFLPLGSLESGSINTVIPCESFFVDVETPSSELLFRTEPQMNDNFSVYFNNAYGGHTLVIEINANVTPVTDTVWIYATDQMGATDSMFVFFTIIQRTNVAPKLSDEYFYKNIYRGETFEPLFLPDYITDDHDFNELTIWTDRCGDSLYTEINDNYLYFYHNRDLLHKTYDILGVNCLVYNIYLYAQDAEGEKDSLLLNLVVENEPPKKFKESEPIIIFPDDTIALGIKEYYFDDYTPFDSIKNRQLIYDVFFPWFNDTKDTIFITPRFEYDYARMINLTFYLFDDENSAGEFQFKIYLQPRRNIAPQFIESDTLIVFTGENYTIDLANYFIDDYTHTSSLHWKIASPVDFVISNDNVHVSIPDTTAIYKLDITACDIHGASTTGQIVMKSLPKEEYLIIDTSACDFLEFADSVFYKSTIFIDTVFLNNETSKITQLNLTIFNTDSVQKDITIPFGSSLQLGSKLLSQSGTYTETFTNSNGCDSVVHLILTVQDNTPPIFEKTNYIFSIAENSDINTVIGTIIAIDADGTDVSLFLENTNLPFEINNARELIVVNSELIDYEIIKQFNFNLYATDGVDTVFVPIIVNITDVENETNINRLDSMIMVYPSVCSDDLFIEIDNVNCEIIIISLTGIIVYKNSISHQLKINTQSFASGKYLVVIYGANRKYIKEFIKKY